MPVGYGIRKLQISCVVEDDKVSTDDLEEKIVAFEDYVRSIQLIPCYFSSLIFTVIFSLFQIQSMDIAAFNKV